MALEWPQHFPHYKSMGIFPDAQGHLTPRSEVEPSRNSNSSKMLWLSMLFPRMKKIQLKNEVARVATTFSPLKLNGSYMLPLKPEF